MSETESLLPCPFCGGSAGFVRVTRGFGVFAGCNLCQASVFAIDENNPPDIASHRKLAADAWNRRVDAIPRATVAAAFLALEHGLRPELFRTPETHAAAMAILSETRAQLGITEEPDAFDALIASRPDVPEKLADEALEETR